MLERVVSVHQITSKTSLYMSVQRLMLAGDRRVEQTSGGREAARRREERVQRERERERVESVCELNALIASSL